MKALVRVAVVLPLGDCHPFLCAGHAIDADVLLPGTETGKELPGVPLACSVYRIPYRYAFKHSFIYVHKRF